jgi:hypothetical protein
VLTSTFGRSIYTTGGRSCSFSPRRRDESGFVACPLRVHSRPNWTVRAISAFLPLATELRTLLEVRFVPISAASHPSSYSGCRI